MKAVIGGGYVFPGVATSPPSDLMEILDGGGG